VIDRAFGCVLGAFIGDAAGAVLEFLEVQQISHKDVQEAMKLEGGGIMGLGKG
jgi:ADP-ribosylglycohydrolase